MYRIIVDAGFVGGVRGVLAPGFGPAAELLYIAS
jgi:hypothetical protein